MGAGRPDDEGPQGAFAGMAFAAVTFALLGYLAFAALQGEHGLFRLFQVEAQEKRFQAELDALRAERAAVESKTRRLSTETLDLDLLDEQARKTLGLGRPDEILIR